MTGAFHEDALPADVAAGLGGKPEPGTCSGHHERLPGGTIRCHCRRAGAAARSGLAGAFGVCWGLSAAWSGRHPPDMWRSRTWPPSHHPPAAACVGAYSGDSSKSKPLADQYCSYPLCSWLQCGVLGPWCSPLLRRQLLETVAASLPRTAVPGDARWRVGCSSGVALDVPLVFTAFAGLHR